MLCDKHILTDGTATISLDNIYKNEIQKSYHINMVRFLNPFILKQYY